MVYKVWVLKTFLSVLFALYGLYIISPHFFTQKTKSCGECLNNQQHELAGDSLYKQGHTFFFSFFFFLFIYFLQKKNDYKPFTTYNIRLKRVLSL